VVKIFQNLSGIKFAGVRVKGVDINQKISINGKQFSKSPHNPSLLMSLKKYTNTNTYYCTV
jgi:hypothetical protein